MNNSHKFILHVAFRGMHIPNKLKTSAREISEMESNYSQSVSIPDVKVESYGKKVESYGLPRPLFVTLLKLMKRELREVLTLHLLSHKKNGELPEVLTLHFFPVTLHFLITLHFS